MQILVKEIWSFPTNMKKSQPLEFVGPVAGAETFELARAHAMERVSKFQHFGFEENALYPYAWGRNDGENFVHYSIRHR